MVIKTILKDYQNYKGVIFMLQDFFTDDNEYVRLPKEELFIQTKLTFIRNPNYNIYQKMLYQLLHTYGIDKRGVYPSQGKLAKELGISRRKVISTLQELEDLGGVYIINQVFVNTKHKTSNLYYISEIDKEGNFNKDSLKIVKKMYSNKTRVLDKPY